MQADRLGNLYAGLKNGDIIKYVDGKEKGRLSTPINAEMASIEPGTGLKIFIFYENLQQYILADRNLTQFELFRLPQSLVNFASSATLSEDLNVWLSDPVDFTLKKISVLNNETLVQVSDESFDIDNWENIFDIKEYGAYLFVGEFGKGVHLFDNFGNFIKLLPFPDIKSFDIHNETLFVLNPTDMKSFNLYNNQQKTYNHSFTGNTEGISFTAGKEFLYFFSENRIYKVKTP